MKIVYNGSEGSGVTVGGIFLKPGKPVEVPDELGKHLLGNPNIKVLKSKRERKQKSKMEMKENGEISSP